MRVLFTIHHILDSNSGAPGAIMAVADTLRKLGHDVELLSHGDLPRWARGRRSFFTFPVLVAWRALRERRLWDVVDYSSSDGWLLAWLPRRLRPVVIMFRSHGLEHIEHERFVEEYHQGRQRMSWKYRWFRGSLHLRLIAFAARRADGAIFLNRSERDFAVTDLGVAAERTAVIANGLIRELLDAQPVLFPDDSQAHLNIAFIGSFIARKGIAYLVPALELHLREYTQAAALFLGTVGSADEIRATFSPAVRERVRVVPVFDRTNLPLLLDQSSVFVLPSVSEGFGTAALEAMACGLVPVLTRGHGFDEFVEHEYNGLLIDRGSAEQIVNALGRLEHDRAALARMRKEAIRTARQFTWERNAQSRLTLYERAMQRNHAVAETQS